MRLRCLFVSALVVGGGLVLWAYAWWRPRILRRCILLPASPLLQTTSFITCAVLWIAPLFDGNIVLLDMKNAILPCFLLVVYLDMKHRYGQLKPCCLLCKLRQLCRLLRYNLKIDLCFLMLSWLVLLVRWLSHWVLSALYYWWLLHNREMFHWPLG